MSGRADRTIAPGQSEQVKVAVSTLKASGKFSRTVKVTTNDPEHPQEKLVCAATVLVPFKMQPSVASFGQLERNVGPQQKTFKLTRGDGGPLAPELLPVAFDNVQASLREIEPGERYELDVQINPPWPNELVRADLRLRTGVSEAPEQTVTVTARFTKRLSVEPSRFGIPPSVRSGLDLRAQLVWSAAGPGKILAVTSSDPETPVSLVEQNGEQVLVLHVPAGYTGPPGGRGTVVVKTDDPTVPTYSIPVYVVGPAQAAPSQSPAPPKVVETAAQPAKPAPGKPKQ